MFMHNGQTVPFLESLDLPTNYIFKEHFSEFREREGRHVEYGRGLPTSVFNLCVDRGESPRYPALIVKNRAELGVSPYREEYPAMPTTYRSAFLAEFGIQVGSVIELLPELEAKPERTLWPQEKFLGELATQLSSQIKMLS